MLCWANRKKLDELFYKKMISKNLRKQKTEKNLWRKKNIIFFLWKLINCSKKNSSLPPWKLSVFVWILGHSWRLLRVTILPRKFCVALCKVSWNWYTDSLGQNKFVRQLHDVTENFIFFALPHCSLALCLKVSSKQPWGLYAKIYAGKNWFYYLRRVSLQVGGIRRFIR